MPFHLSAARETASEKMVAYETLGSNRKSQTTQPHTHTHTHIRGTGFFAPLEKKKRGKQKQGEKQKSLVREIMGGWMATKSRLVEVS